MDAIFDYRLPSPALRDYVRTLQIVGCLFPASMPILPVKSYWPRAENSLAFYPKDPEKQAYGFDGNLLEKTRSTLNGQYSIVTNRHVGRNFMVFQVQFQPGALFRLTGIPSHELTNTFVDAESVFSTEIRRVNERLSYTKHYLDMIPIVETFLFYLINRAKSRHPRPIDNVSRFILQNPMTVSLDWMANQACLSQRQFYRQFMEREGVSPKLYARIARFENAMKLKNARPSLDWLSVAIQLGYYDYQHLVRDFKEFTQLTPNAFFIADTKSPERVFGVAET
ncbi:AraC family transcriptional regulator [Spirosoma sp. KCTC 42546]|uniref:helix-turn-helix domain-containing protein n=1 Tax=Spirosoma sp. KCTC 42546 TaxID=2520506 RepID=UPI00115B3336|nr:helix-turn-helix domain-containing protein [Spirosoma sp. KCTC 42546]QDK82075.1 AraC family transcriptional regulator [Spirosoma sp. KCTC 42546]